MKKDQFKRWKDFSLRMASKAIDCEDDQADELVGLIEGMFEYFEDHGYRRLYPEHQWRTIDSWDGWFGDWFAEDFDYLRKFDENEEEIVDGIYNRLSCCVRAGLDMASMPSGGVLGFTKADILAMYYPEGVPAWVASRFENWHSMPAETGVWL